MDWAEAERMFWLFTSVDMACCIARRGKVMCTVYCIRSGSSGSLDCGDRDSSLLHTVVTRQKKYML